MPRADFSSGVKICSKCKKAQPLSAYPPHKTTWDRLASWCRTCQSKHAKAMRDANSEERRAKERAAYPKWKDRYIFRTYGLTPADVALLRASQAESCAACGRDLRTMKFRWHIDHDHATGAVRGILCHPCNSALGLLGDSSERVRALLKYIEGFE